MRSVAIALVLLVLPALTDAGAPPLINFQARIIDDATGEPSEGPHAVTFTIYSDECVSELWSEIHVGIFPDNGIFNVLIGSVNAFPDDLFDSGDRWLGVEVDGSELLPCQRLVSVPYALSWKGGTVSNPTTFLGDMIAADIRLFQGELGGHARMRILGSGLSIEAFNADNDKTVNFDGNASPELELFGQPSGSEARLIATTSGDARMQLDSDSVNLCANLQCDDDDGGGAHLRLTGPAATFEWNTNTGAMTVLNSRGEVTFELDPETGNVYYSGQLLKREARR